jgi:hypothetical protein
MQVALDLSLIRALESTELRLHPGRVLMARVVRAQGSERGSLSLAGAVIDAELPKHLRAGDEVRLTVRHVSAQRIVLELSHAPAPAAPPPIPLPGGGVVRITEHERRADVAGGAEVHTLSVRYEAPTLGAVDLRFELDTRSLRVSAALGAGDPVTRAQKQADQLREALAAALERAVSVRIAPRREPLDVYA